MLLILSSWQYITAKVMGSNMHVKLYMQRVKHTKINIHKHLPISRPKEATQLFHKHVLLHKYCLS